jgi:hypothetical protein
MNGATVRIRASPPTARLGNATWQRDLALHDGPASAAADCTILILVRMQETSSIIFNLLKVFGESCAPFTPVS